MKISAPLLWFRAFFLTYSVKKYQLYCEGDPVTVLPFAPQRFFRKLEATAFPIHLSENSEKITIVGIDVLLQITEIGRRSSTRSRDIWRGIFGDFPNFLKIGDNDFPQNFIECMGVGLRRNQQVWTILLEPFFIKIDVHILPPGSVNPRL